MINYECQQILCKSLKILMTDQNTSLYSYVQQNNQLLNFEKHYSYYNIYPIGTLFTEVALGSTSVMGPP